MIRINWGIALIDRVGFGVLCLALGTGTVVLVRPSGVPAETVSASSTATGAPIAVAPSSAARFGAPATTGLVAVALQAAVTRGAVGPVADAPATHKEQKRRRAGHIPAYGAQGPAAPGPAAQGPAAQGLAAPRPAAPDPAAPDPADTPPQVADPPAAPTPSTAPRTTTPPSAAPRPPPTPLPTDSDRGTAVFQVASFNVLGAGHTAPGGDRRGWASGVTRMHAAVELLRGSGADVVGLQEFQQPQARTFDTLLGAGWDSYPGLAMGPRVVQNSVAWDVATWRRVDAHLVSVPYFHGRPMPMPYVLLEHRATGRRVWFLNVHNPADAHGPAARFRAQAISVEVALINRLSATGTPVVMTGDLNDRAPALCGLASRAQLRSADGGGVGAGGGCRVPPRAAVDWVLATPAAQLSGYQRRTSGVQGRISDHPFVMATATVDG